MNYLLVGSEAYTLKKRRQELIDQTVGRDNDLAVSLYRGVDKVEVSEIIEDCRTLPLLSDQKAVVWENPPFLAEGRQEKGAEEQLEALIGYLKDDNPSTTLIISCEGSLSERARQIRQLSPLMKLERFESLTGDEFANLVNRDLNESGLKLDRKASEELFRRLPVNIENWKHELEKLKLYPGKIDQQVICDLICRPLEDNVFELSNAVVDHRLADAVRIYRDLMVTHKNDIPSLIGLLANQLRTMSQVRIMIDMNYSDEQIAQAINTKSSYRVKMVRKAIGSSTGKQLLELLSELSQLDQNIKSGLIDGQSGLELFVIRACKR
ncbi:MAG: DNA polymerase III subunit delta [Erysipelotrichaceae bacterium]|nr:DNA polymerase III subunit delta [Erysipelotrichaceae bacterium]